MPSVSKKQQRFMAIQYEKKKAGKATTVDMSLQNLHDFASTKRKGLTDKKKSHK
jgi:hypothetical protein